MRKVLPILCFACVGAAASAGASPQYETILGEVVAYSAPIDCSSGMGYWSVIIRVQDRKSRGLKFIRVDFTLPCEKSPAWVMTKPSVQKFRLRRDKACDEALEEFMEVEQKREIKLPLWQAPPGAARATLPFGEVLACYEPVDIPVAPGL